MLKTSATEWSNELKFRKNDRAEFHVFVLSSCVCVFVVFGSAVLFLRASLLYFIAMFIAHSYWLKCRTRRAHTRAPFVQV